jgi:hypothetical protein
MTCPTCTNQTSGVSGLEWCRYCGTVVSETDGTAEVPLAFRGLLEEAKKLLALMDTAAIDSRLGDETDRVFPHYEFNGLRAAIAKAEGRA